MSKLIHINDARKLLERRNPVSLKCFTSKGELMICNNVVVTSSYFKGKTFNIRFLSSGEIRKIKSVCLIEINGQEVYL
jgi:hypothetical protein